MADHSSQFFLFKDNIARRILAHPAMTDSEDSDEGLDDFSSYLASESWPSIPPSIREATYETRTSVPDPNSDSLSLENISPAFIDTLISYGLASDTDDAIKFLRRSLEGYVEDACSPPPVWKATRVKECEICDREVPLTYHHLIPRSTHTKVLKKGWHKEAMLGSVAWLCRPCHSAVHHVARNEDLARNYYTIDLLLEREDIQKWQKYAAKQRWGVRRG
ncbi:hypothetical protein BDQ12DRAFT_631970 [Crucibulum laeve]|uniref:HNH domain-containing protein n=1 Tax=Crucibulum laeve TaxID=68775 RepID=A0A5C3LYF1_9AGAR|nr:hypothetical protein BDQ12DRAFT_631970 [Crucibulum laeve]